MSNEIALSGLAISLYYLSVMRNKKRANKKPPRWWDRGLLKGGNKYEHDLLDTLKLEDGMGFRNFVRMRSVDFELLLKMVGPHISKKKTNFREPVSTTNRLAITLRFLASGDSYTSLMYTFKVSKQITSEFVPEVCTAINIALRTYIRLPRTSAEWQSIAAEFSSRWNFSKCIGSIDGKHVAVVAPEHSGSLYFNYKGFHSIVAMAVADAKYNFMYLDVGCQGRISDRGVFHYTPLYEKITHELLDLPAPSALPGREICVPHVFVADDAFPLSTNIMKPFPGVTKGLLTPERKYNYRHSRARWIIENVFGIWSSKFRVLLKTLDLHPDKVEVVCLTCAYLHNFLRRNAYSRNYYTPPGTFDVEDHEGNVIHGSWRSQVENDAQSLTGLQQIPRRAAVDAKQIRNEFRDYFMSSEGSVPWQASMV